MTTGHTFRNPRDYVRGPHHRVIVARVRRIWHARRPNEVEDHRLRRSKVHGWWTLRDQRINPDAQNQ